ncbi:MAG TPA: hypothetical protein VEZ24_06410 [Microvirga sp.]|nr:hypothetical protein [Microvirga sp.]
MSVRATEPGAEILVQPLGVWRRISKLEDWVIPNSDDLLLQGKLPYNSLDAQFRHSPLTLDGSLIAFLNGPEDSGCCKSKSDYRNSANECQDLVQGLRTWSVKKKYGITQLFTRSKLGER